MTRGPVVGPDSSRIPAWLDRSGAVALRLLALAVLVWLLAELIGKLTLVVVAVLVALLLAGVFAPVVQWAAGRGVRRWMAAAAVVLALLGVLAGTVFGLSLRVVDQLPELRQQLQSVSGDLAGALGLQRPSLGGSGSGGGSSALPGLAGSARLAADVLVGFFLTLALAFLFLTDGARMWAWALDKLGGQVRDDVDAAGRAAWGTVGAYVRGLTLVAVFDAVGIGLGLLVLGVPLPLTLAALQFLLSYIPTFGAVVAGLVAVGVGYASGGLGTAVAVLVLVVVVQQVGNDVVEPYVMGRDLPINAAVVLIAVTAGGLLWGVAGALLFVPLTAAASAAGHELWVRHGRRPIAGG